jgi:hypothetical protein
VQEVAQPTADDEGYGGESYGGEAESEPEPPPPPMPPTLSGSWTSDCTPAPDGKGSATISAVMTGDRWEIDVLGFTDAACARKSMTLHMTGGYTIGEMSATEANSWAIDLVADSHQLTAADKATAKALGKACAIKKMKAGKAYDIHAKGCAAVHVKPADACATEFQLVRQIGNRIYFGLETPGNDLCAPERRPAAVEKAFSFRWVWPPTGVAECDAMLTQMDAYIACGQIPDDAKTQVFESVRMSFAGDTTNLPPEAKAAMVEGCTAGSQGIADGMKALGCTAP